jgi:thymidylate synthase (FAD)
MNVKLISVTEPWFSLENSEDLVAYIARVSNPDNQMNTETAPKLLRYLIKNKHWSPFEMVDMTVEIKTSRAIAAQILRHRSFSFQEFSQRYSSPMEFEPIELRLQAEKNRQSSEKVIRDTELQKEVEAVIAGCIYTYNKMIKSGVSKETARFILPLTTQTTLYMKGSLRSWIHYIELRTDPHTQKEHREIALEIKNIFTSSYPIIAEALGW